MVGDSMIVPPKAECEDMQVQKVSNHVLEDSTLECGIPNQLSQLCEKNGNNTTHENFGEQMEEEIAEYLTKSKHNEEEAQRKREEEEPGSGAMGEREVGLDLFFANAFELFDPDINTSVHQFIYALPVSYLQQLQQHMTCQPVGTVLWGNIFYWKAPNEINGFGLPIGDENEVIQSTTSIELNWPWDPGSLGSDFKTKLLVLTYATLNAELLLPWDLGEHEPFVRFIDTSGTTCRQKFLMVAVNWHFVNLKEFEGSGNCTSKDHQLQARRICSSYSLAGSLGEHSCRCDNCCNCSPIILKWVTASASVVLYLRTCTLSLLKSVSYLSINLLSKGVLMVSVLYSSIVLQVLQTTYISLLDMNAQGDFHATDCYHLSLHEFSAIIFALFKVCINIWNSADTRARELTGNVTDTYSRLFATALLQVEMCIVLDLQIFDSIVHVLYITKVEKSPTTQNEQVQMGKIAKYMHWTQCSDFIYLKDFLMNNDSSLRWFPSSKRTFSQWDPGIEVNMHIHKILNCSTTRVFKWNQVLVKESIAHASVCFKCKTTGCPTDSIVSGHTETSMDLKQTGYYELLMSKLLAMWLLLRQYLRFCEIDGWLVTYQPP